MGSNAPEPQGAAGAPDEARILACVPDPVFRWDLKAQRMDYCNGAWQEVLGWSPQELRAMGGELPARLVHAEDYGKAARAAKAALAEGGTAPLGPIELRIRHKEGHSVWVNLTLGFVLGPDGLPRWAVGTARDISAWREALRAVERSRERYRSLFGACPIALLEYDASAVRDTLDSLVSDGTDDVGSHLLARSELLAELAGRTRVLDANDTAVSLLKAESKEQLLVGLDAFFGPESCAAFVQAVAVLARGRARFETELPIRAMDGQALLARVSISPAPGHEETYLRVLVAVSDVTQQRRSEETMRALLNAPSDVILLMDTQGIVLAANDSWAAKLGCAPDDLVGRCVYDLSSPEVVDCRRAVADQVTRTGRPAHYSEFRSDAVYDTTAYPLFGREGGVERLAIIARDVTEDVARHRRLADTERIAAQTVRSIPSGLLVYDYEPPDRFRLAEANPAAEEFTLLNAAEGRGRLFREIWPDSYREGVTEAYVRVMETGRPEAREMTYHAADGSLSHVFRARMFRLSSRRLGVAFEDVSAERKAELALQASEAAARALLNAPSETMMLTDLDGRVLDLNESAAKRLGLPREELIGRAPGDVLGPELAKARMRRLRQVAETGKPVRYEDRRGDYVFETAVHPVPGEDGSVQSLAIFAREVGELRSAREALAETQRAAKQLVDALPSGLRVFRHKEPDIFILEYENAGAESIHGVPFQEARGKSFRELFPAAYADGATELYMQVWRTGEAGERIWTEHDERGDLTYAAHTNVFRLDADRIGVAFIPVTDRLRAEHARQEIEARYRALIESIPAVTYTAALDEKSTTTYINPQVAGLLGYSVEDYAQDPDLWRELLHPEDAGRVMAAVAHSHESGEHFTCEYRLRRKDGGYVWVRDEAAIVHDPEGRPQMLQGVMMDITERRAVEPALIDHQEGLRRLNSELSRVEEAERRRIAEGLHDHVGQLLVSAKMRLEALLNRERSPADNEWLGEIAGLVDQAAEATQDLTFELSPPVLHQLGLVPGIEWLSEHMAKTHDLAVDMKAANGRLDLPEDIAVLLFRSVSELLNNVAKHARTRRATVAIEAVNGEARIAVSDDGTGFDPAEVQAAGRRAGGFGLFSVRERLHAVGGDIEIVSQPGRGTCVTIRVPLVDA